MSSKPLPKLLARSSESIKLLETQRVNNNKLRLLVDSMDLNHHPTVEVLVEVAEEEVKFQDSRPCKAEVESDIINKYYCN